MCSRKLELIYSQCTGHCVKSNSWGQELASNKGSQSLQYPNTSVCSKGDFFELQIAFPSMFTWIWATCFPSAIPVYCLKQFEVWHVSQVWCIDFFELMIYFPAVAWLNSHVSSGELNCSKDFIIEATKEEIWKVSPLQWALQRTPKSWAIQFGKRRHR